MWDLVPKLVSGEWELTLIRAIMTTAFHGLFHLGELVIASAGPNQSAAQVRRHNLQQVGSKIVLGVENAITAKDGELQHVILECIPGSTICPVTNLQSYLKLSPSNIGPLFQQINGKSVTRQFFMKKLGKLINLAKLPNNVILGHSFRIGSATHLSLQGFSIDQIKLKGRWTSNSYKTYLRKPQTVEENRQQAQVTYKKPRLPDFSSQANSFTDQGKVKLSRSPPKPRVKQQVRSKTRKAVPKDPHLFLRDCQIGIMKDHLSMPDFEDKVTRSTKHSHMGSLADFNNHNQNFSMPQPITLKRNLNFKETHHKCMIMMNFYYK